MHPRRLLVDTIRVFRRGGHPWDEVPTGEGSEGCDLHSFGNEPLKGLPADSIIKITYSNDATLAAKCSVKEVMPFTR